MTSSPINHLAIEDNLKETALEKLYGYNSAKDTTDFDADDKKQDACSNDNHLFRVEGERGDNEDDNDSTISSLHSDDNYDFINEEIDPLVLKDRIKSSFGDELAKKIPCDLFLSDIMDLVAKNFNDREQTVKNKFVYFDGSYKGEEVTIKIINKAYPDILDAEKDFDRELEIRFKILSQTLKFHGTNNSINFAKLLGIGIKPFKFFVIQRVRKSLDAVLEILSLEHTSMSCSPGGKNISLENQLLAHTLLYKFCKRVTCFSDSKESATIECASRFTRSENELGANFNYIDFILKVLGQVIKIIYFLKDSMKETSVDVNINISAQKLGFVHDGSLVLYYIDLIPKDSDTDDFIVDTCCKFVVGHLMSWLKTRNGSEYKRKLKDCHSLVHKFIAGDEKGNSIYLQEGLIDNLLQEAKDSNEDNNYFPRRKRMQRHLIERYWF